MYNLDSNTLTARFYAWIWNTNVTKFRNMCPYFWKYVLTILFLPLVLAGKFVGYLFGLIPTSKKLAAVGDAIFNSNAAKKTDSFFDWIGSHTNFWNAVGKTFKWIFFIIAGALALFVVGALIYLLITKTAESLSFLGLLTLLVGVAVLILWLFIEKDLGSVLATPFKFVGNMIYSTYKNMCPLIKWDN